MLVDETSNTLQKLFVQKELDMQRQKAKKAVLDKLSCGHSDESIAPELKTKLVVDTFFIIPCHSAPPYVIFDIKGISEIQEISQFQKQGHSSK